VARCGEGPSLLDGRAAPVARSSRALRAHGRAASHRPGWWAHLVGALRVHPAEVRANQSGSDQIGSSGLAGVSTKVVFGDPSKSGFDTIVLSVPAHTTIQAHTDRDDRMAVVVSGTWHFG
jgi:hypothetical protein